MATSSSTARPRRRRRDAEENLRAILDAARAELGRDPDASMTRIAAAAGVTRQTVYAHFAGRDEVLSALLDEALTRGEHAYDAALADSDGEPPPQRLGRLVLAAWTSLAPYRRLVDQVLTTLGTDEHRRRHAALADRVAAVVRDGQRDGSFDSGRPAPWLVATVFALVHAAAAEIEAGTLDPDDGPRWLTATVLAALRPPDGRR